MSDRRYKVQFTEAAARQVRKLSREIERRIIAKADSLGADPRPPGAAKLSGTGDFYRVRVGDYRIIYRIEDDVLLVVVIRVGHRRDVYR